MRIGRVGLDLAKYVFEVHAVDAADKVVLRKTLRRDAVARFFSGLPACVVGMEACGGAHYRAKVLADPGYEVRLVSPQFVKPHVKSNKNDRNDAEAICAAAGRPSMRFVPVKSSGQLAIRAVHRIRQRLVGDRTRLANQIRGLLAEHGIVIAREITRCGMRLRGSLVDRSRDRTRCSRIDLVRDMKTELAEPDRRLAVHDRRIRELFRGNEMCQRISKIEGIGPITATALVAAVGDRTCFRNGRRFAAWLGLVPRQQSSGGKARLFGISKRGDRYLRTLMIRGARAVLGKAGGKQDPSSQWIRRMRDRRHPNVVSVALADRNARIVWSILARDEDCRPGRTAVGIREPEGSL